MIFRPSLLGFRGSGSGGSGSFISTLTKLAWLDAQAAGSVLDAGGAAASDGEAVATWTAQVGANATQATGGLRPTYDADGLNGLPAVRFNGSQQFSWLQAAANANGYTVFVVCDIATASEVGRVLCTQGAAPEGLLALDYTNSNVIGTFSSGNFRSGTKAITGGGPRVAVWARNPDQSGRFFVDGASAGTFPNSAGDAALPSIGGYNSFGTVLQGITGTISEILIVETDLSADDIQRVTDELKVKWGQVTEVFFAGGQSNATQEWADAILARLKVLYGHDNIVLAWNQHGGQPLIRWRTDDGPGVLYQTGDVPNGIPGLLTSIQTVMASVRAAGRYPRFRGFFWFQGESDALDEATRTNSFEPDIPPAQWLYYRTRFNEMMFQLKSDLSLNSPVKFCLCLPAFDVTTGNPNPWGTVQADLEEVRAIQIRLGGQSNGSYLETLGFSRQDRIHIHQSNGAETLVGTAAANAFYAAFES